MYQKFHVANKIFSCSVQLENFHRKRMVLHDTKLSASASSKSAKYQKEKVVLGGSEQRIKVSADRFIVPGDYVVHEEYGVGRYIGIRFTHISPASITPSQSEAEIRKKSVPLVVVQFDDAEITWFQKFAGLIRTPQHFTLYLLIYLNVEKQLWVYRSADSGIQLLSSILDKRKWNRRKKFAEDKIQRSFDSHVRMKFICYLLLIVLCSMAIDLLHLMALRNSVQRPPCQPDSTDGRYADFERRFTYEPTTDQLECFKVRKQILLIFVK